MSPAEIETVADCAVACRQIAQLLNTVVDANEDDTQLIDSLTAVARLAQHTSDRLNAITG